MKIINWCRLCNYEIVNGLYVLKNDVWIDFEHNNTKFRIKVDKGGAAASNATIVDMRIMFKK